MNLFEQSLLASAVLAPLVATLILAIRSWVGVRENERVVDFVSALAFGVSFCASAGLMVVLLSSGQDHVVLEVTKWFSSGSFSRSIEFVADRLSLPFATFVAALLGIVAAFSRKYLHRESGYRRYHLLLCLFGSGTLILVFAGSLDFLFFGWETVGLTSALLIAFFHERKAPVSHALRAFVTYRVCDIGLLGAAAWLHHSVGSTSSAAGELLPWWGIEVPRHAFDQTVVGLLLLWACLGKSAQVPFSGWLPRAMEGPTPSSAIFYGAISVHLGPYLLLRAGAILDSAPWVAAAVVMVGAATAIHGTIVGRVQSDIKSSLAYASMVQVGVIFVEIGFGLRYLALFHIISHATLRCLQILRLPSILHDYLNFERSLGTTLPRLGQHFEKALPSRIELWLYRGALERGFLDGFLRDRFVSPVLLVVRRLDLIEEAWADFLIGKKRIVLTPPESVAARGGE